MNKRLHVIASAATFAIFCAIVAHLFTVDQAIQRNAAIDRVEHAHLYDVIEDHASRSTRLIEHVPQSIGPANTTLFDSIKVNTLATFAGAVQMTNSIAPAALNGTVNDYAPTGLSTANLIRQDASSNSTITGISAQPTGQEVVIQNISTTFTITLTNADAGSAAANRFTLPSALSWVIPPGGAVWLRYSGSTTTWRLTATDNYNGNFNTLTANGLFTAAGPVDYTNTITPANLNGTVSNYNPTGLSTASLINQGLTSSSIITGLTAQDTGRRLMIHNLSATLNIILDHEDATSTAANRFTLPNAANWQIPPNGTVSLFYTGTRWVVDNADNLTGTFSNMSLNAAGVFDAAAARINVGALDLTANNTGNVSGNINNWNPSLATLSGIYRINTTGATTITGFVNASFAGRQVYWENIGNSNITVTNLDASSSAGNQILTPNSVTATIMPGGTAHLYYDLALTEWIMDYVSTGGAGTFGGSPLFGAGADGAVVFDGSSTVLGLAPSSNTYTLTRAIFPTNVTVNGGVTIKVDSNYIAATGTLTNNGNINADGAAGSGATAGAANSANWYAANAAGGAGGSAAVGSNAGAVSNIFPPAWGQAVGTRGAGSATTGGTGGACTGGGGGGSTNTGGSGGVPTQAAANNASPPYLSVSQGRFGATLATQFTYGTGGGGGGSTTSGVGGGGGASGQMLFIQARYIKGTGTMSANGGAGAAGSGAGGAGGGGGGGGGVVLVVYGSMAGASQTITANGGAQGAGANGGGNGGPGGNCLVMKMNLSGDGS